MSAAGQGSLDSEARERVSRLLAALCSEHSIAPAPALEWSVRMRRMLGRAYMRDGVIRLSAWLDEGQAAETLRHELAHIVDHQHRRGRGRAAPHGEAWREWAVRLGAVPRATARQGPALAPEPAERPHTGLACPGCGARFVRARVLRGLYCRACGPRRGRLSKALRGPRSEVVAWAERRAPAPEG
ncbi:MAG: SprT-like domain-containing protein [Chloroflexota bacterium]